MASALFSGIVGNVIVENDFPKDASLLKNIKDKLKNTFRDIQAFQSSTLEFFKLQK